MPVKDKLNWVNILSWLTFDWSWFALFIRVNVLHALGNGDADFFFWNPLFPKDDPRRKAMCSVGAVRRDRLPRPHRRRSSSSISGWSSTSCSRITSPASWPT